jgi:hypothetical protein
LVVQIDIQRLVLDLVSCQGQRLGQEAIIPLALFGEKEKPTYFGTA